MQQRDSPYSTPFLHEQEKCDFFMSKEKTHSQKHTLDWTQTQEKQTPTQWSKTINFSNV